MKKITFLFMAISLSALAFFAMKEKKHNLAAPPIKNSGVVLELFTSEGCSSCPPAEDLLAKLVKENPSVIALSFHVDYWDRLGWKDAYSDAKYTERQNAYANHFMIESIYTPQLVINGQYEGVGSNKSFAEESIQKAEVEMPATILSVQNEKQKDNSVTFDILANGMLDKTNLVAALVEKKASTPVKAGENRGVTISHTNIVRDFKTVDAASHATLTLKIPADLPNDNWEIIVFAQDKKTSHITGATTWQP
jgi:hypothetical protein